MQGSKFIFITSFIIAAPVVPPAIAQDFYAEGVVGTVDFSNSSVFDDNTFTTFGGRLGAKVTPNFSIEGEALFGDSTDTILETSSTLDPSDLSDPVLTTISGELELSSTYSLFGKADLPLTDRITAFGRIGVTHTNVETKFRTSRSDQPNDVRVSKSNVDEIGFAFGVGAEFEVNERFYMRGDLTHYEFDEQDINSFQLGVGMKF
ncbi:MAG: porin family protein [Pseudomonadota bacterium]